jgi:hypothetical protein
MFYRATIDVHGIGSSQFSYERTRNPRQTSIQQTSIPATRHRSLIISAYQDKAASIQASLALLR